MATPQENAPYQQSRSAMRRIYGSRAIDARAPNVSPESKLPGRGELPGTMGGGLTPASRWKDFFHPADKPAPPSGPPMLWDKIRSNLASKPISDVAFSKIRADMNPMRNIATPIQTQTTSQLSPDDAPDVSSVASFYEPPPQLGGPRSLLMDPEGYASFDNTPSPIGGSSAFFRKYGKMRDLSTLGQDNFML